jgi:hypothetical protein
VIATNFNLLDGSGSTIFSDGTSMDWNANGSGVTVGNGPFGTALTVGDKFDFYYQSNLVNIDGSVPSGMATAAGGGVLGANSFQITAVASFTESVIAYTVPPGGFPTAQFLPDLTQSATVSLFYDSTGGTIADTAAGTGFADGTEIARFSIGSSPTYPTFSSFTQTSLTGGNGTTNIYGYVDAAAGDFVDPDYLTGVLNPVFDFEYTSNLQYPPGTSDTAAFFLGSILPAIYTPYPVVADDIVFKVDGSNTFTTVPEPATIALLGGGLLGLNVVTRRRKAKRQA